MGKLIKCVWHWFVKLVIQKCQIKFAIMTNQRLSRFRKHLYYATKTNFELHKFANFLFNFSINLFFIFLFFIVFFFYFFHLFCRNYFVWFFRIFLVAESELRIYNCNCCIFAWYLRFYETSACLALIRRRDHRLRLQELKLLKLLWFFNNGFRTLSGKFSENSCTHIYLGNLSAQSFLKRITFNCESYFFFSCWIKSKVSNSI